MIRFPGSEIMEIQCDNNPTARGRLSGLMKKHRAKVMASHARVPVSHDDTSHGFCPPDGVTSRPKPLVNLRLNSTKDRSLNQ